MKCMTFRALKCILCINYRGMSRVGLDEVHFMQHIFVIRPKTGGFRKIRCMKCISHFRFWPNRQYEVHEMDLLMRMKCILCT